MNVEVSRCMAAEEPSNRNEGGLSCRDSKTNLFIPSHGDPDGIILSKKINRYILLSCLKECRVVEVSRCLAVEFC
jgi:hypothetical protein